VIKLTNQIFTYTTYIAASPSRVWKALTTSEDTAEYFFGRKIYSTWKLGDKVEFLREHDELDVVGEITEIIHGQKLSYTWNVPGDLSLRDHPSNVTFELASLDDAVKLTLTHRDFIEGDTVQETNTFVGLNNGWPAIISNLKSYLETGKPLKAIKA